MGAASKTTSWTSLQWFSHMWRLSSTSFTLSCLPSDGNLSRSFRPVEHQERHQNFLYLYIKMWHADMKGGLTGLETLRVEFGLFPLLEEEAVEQHLVQHNISQCPAL